MRRWVEYNDGRVLELDKKRLLIRAIAFKKACEDYKNECGVSAVAHYYKPYLDASLEGKIHSPVMERLPYTGEMRERQLPEVFHSLLNRFCDAIESRPAIYNYLDSETLYHHREKFIKEENGKTYIFEYFEDEE